MTATRNALTQGWQSDTESFWQQPITVHWMEENINPSVRCCLRHHATFSCSSATLASSSDQTKIFSSAGEKKKIHRDSRRPMKSVHSHRWANKNDCLCTSNCFHTQFKYHSKYNCFCTSASFNGYIALAATVRPQLPAAKFQCPATSDPVKHTFVYIFVQLRQFWHFDRQFDRQHITLKEGGRRPTFLKATYNYLKSHWHAERSKLSMSANHTYTEEENVQQHFWKESGGTGLIRTLYKMAKTRSCLSSGGWADVFAGRQRRPATESISPLSVWMISWRHAAIAGCYRRLLSQSSLLAGNLGHNSLSFSPQILHDSRESSGTWALMFIYWAICKKTQVKVCNWICTLISWGVVGTSWWGR